MMLNCSGIEKLHGFMMHNVMLAVGRISNFQMLAAMPDCTSDFGPIFSRKWVMTNDKYLSSNSFLI